MCTITQSIRKSSVAMLNTHCHGLALNCLSLLLELPLGEIINCCAFEGNLPPALLQQNGAAHLPGILVQDCICTNPQLKLEKHRTKCCANTQYAAAFTPNVCNLHESLQTDDERKDACLSGLCSWQNGFQRVYLI